MIRVLLVEDDPVIRDTTCYFLKSQQNFEVVCAETGGDALSHAHQRNNRKQTGHNNFTNRILFHEDIYF